MTTGGVCFVVAYAALLVSFLANPKGRRAFVDIWERLKVMLTLGRYQTPPPPPALEEGELWAGEHALDRRFDELLEPIAIGPVEVWTAAEREVFDTDATQRFIDDLDRTLKGIEWDRIKATEGPRGIISITNGHPTRLVPDRDVRLNYALGGIVR